MEIHRLKLYWFLFPELSSYQFARDSECSRTSRCIEWNA